MAATDAVFLITSATFNATALGFTQSWEWKYTPTDSPVMGEGHTGTQAIGTVAEDMTVTLNWLIAPFIAVSTAPATLVLVGKDAAGGAKTFTFIQMKPREVEHRMTNGGQGMWSQTFRYIGTFDTFPLTIT